MPDVIEGPRGGVRAPVEVRASQAKTGAKEWRVSRERGMTGLESIRIEERGRARHNTSRGKHES